MNISITILHKSLWLSGVLLKLHFLKWICWLFKGHRHISSCLYILLNCSPVSLGGSAFASYPGQFSALKTLYLPGRVKMVCDCFDVYFLDYQQERAYFQVLISLCSSASAYRLLWPLCIYPLEWAAGCTTLGPVSFMCAGPDSTGEGPFDGHGDGLAAC